jgi:hypothetical protein
LDQNLDLLIALPVAKAVGVKALATGKAVGKRAEGAPAAAALPAASTLTHRDKANSARPIDDSDPYAK